MNMLRLDRVIESNKFYDALLFVFSEFHFFFSGELFEFTFFRAEHFVDVALIADGMKDTVFENIVSRFGFVVNPYCIIYNSLLLLFF